ncbi:MAG TPA: hypothetical protein VF201_07180 [Nitrolancea sp.]
MFGALPSSSPGHPAPRQRARRLLANMLTSLMVNAAILLAAPKASGRDPAPIVLQQKRELFEGQWAAGELVGVETPMVVIVALEERVQSSWISPN